MATKKQCQPYLDKLNNIQSLQRSGYSNKRGRSLAERESKARDKWWKCQTGRLKSNKKQRRTKQGTGKHRKKQSLKTHINTDLVSQYSGGVVIKGRYQGKQQQAWLDFYKMPSKCLKPKSTNVFAFCMEHRTQQQNIFERQYHEVK